MILAVDVGTSVTKVLVFDKNGRVHATCRVSYPTQRPQLGWAEQDPNSWWLAVCQAMRAVTRRLRTSKMNIEGIGLTGQMHGLVLLGREGKPLIPCLIWMDRRAENYPQKLYEQVDQKTLLFRTGNLAIPAFPAVKLLWVKEKLPHIYKKTRWILMPKDYIGYRLTGEIATDPTDASGTLLYNLHHHVWDDDLLTAIGIPRKSLPPIKSSTSVLGKVKAQAAKDLLVPAGTPVVMGAGDLATSALGVGVVTSERVGLILGTAGQILFTLNEYPSQLLGKFYCFAHAIPSSFLGLGTLPTGGAAIAWLARITNPLGSPQKNNIKTLLSLAELARPGADGLFFLPYLAGTGTPHMDYTAKGAFLGLTEAHGQAQIVRAVLEGVGYAMRESLQLLWDLGVCQKEIMVAGGSARSKAFVQILADILGHPFHLVKTLDASPLGAFVLTAVGLGLYADLQKACEEIIKIQETIFPTEASRCYNEHFETFRYLSKKWRGGEKV